MAAVDSDSDEDLVSYGTGLQPLEEGERPKKPVPLQDQTVRDEKGRYKRFHGAFSGGFSAGYFNTNRADKSVLGPEDFMDEEDLSEFGIAPKAIVTTDDFASKTKDRIREKARQLAAAAAPIPGATLLDDIITPAKLGRDEDDDYLPDNVTFAPKDVMPVDFTPKDNVHGLAYKGLDPRQALFGTPGEHLNLFGGPSEGTSHLLEDVGLSKGRKLGISGQAFGVGALEEEDDDIYATETLSKYDTVLKDEEPGDGLYGWTAPKQYKNHKGSATSVLEFLSQKDKERIKETKQAADLKAAQAKARSLAQTACSSREQTSTPDLAYSSWHLALGSGTATTRASNFKPFAKDPEKQRRYEEFLVHMKKGQKDALERCLDPSMTEWERSREREEFARAAQLYGAPHSTLSSRFTHAKEEDDSDQNDVSDKQSAVKMKMFGKLTRDTFEWHPDKLLCKRFNVPDPYPGSTLVGLPRVKRDKYSVFNFLTLPEPAPPPTAPVPSEKAPQQRGPDKSRKPSRWDTSKQEKKEDSISEFLSQARSKVGPPRQEPSAPGNKEAQQAPEPPPDKAEVVSTMFITGCSALLLQESEESAVFSGKDTKTQVY
ncbi:hypothetical protein A6R68_16348 [Neotoma lepida]|uniref:G patch domain-containing protein n=1 Tax=Neotoma lepida TaxID=56216 RepID=A0A1A6HHR8_NEOLE|nr:hypothetical protein A6R68_16348 [Neotoma lepida]